MPEADQIEHESDRVVAALTPDGASPVHRETPVPAVRFRGADGWVVLALLLIGVGVPVLIGLAAGALTLPHNDDPIYRRIALGFYETGRVELLNWGVTSFLGQLFFTQPFLWLSGGAAWAFPASTMVLATIGIAASYLLVRMILSLSRATLAVMTILFFPGFLLNTTSFMTDVPAYSAQTLCVLLGAVALRRTGRAHWGWLVASLAVGCFAFSIREFAVAAPAAVAVASIASAGKAWRSHLLVGVAAAASCVAVYVVTAHLPNQASAGFSPLTSTNITAARWAVATLAFVLSPAIVLAGAWWLPRTRRVDQLLGAAVGAVLFRDELLSLITTQAVPRVIVGNLFDATGALSSGILTGIRPALWGAPLWSLFNAVAIIAVLFGFALLGAIVGSVIRRRSFGSQGVVGWTGSVTGLVTVYAAMLAGGLLAFGLGIVMYDRYLWPIVVPAAALLLLRPPLFDTKARATEAVASRRARSASVGLLACLGVIALVLLLNAKAFDAARWRFGDEAVRRGFGADVVDAGYEWVSTYARGLGDAHAPVRAGQIWYYRVWPSFHACAVVSSTLYIGAGIPLEMGDIAAYRLWLIGGPSEPMYLYRVVSPACG